MSIKNLTILGQLQFAEADIELQANWIAIQGQGAKLSIGSISEPFTKRATITLNATDPTESVMGMGTRGLLVMRGGSLDLFGKAPLVAWTRLAAHAIAGENQLTLQDSSNWLAGDEVIVTPTTYFPLDVPGQPRAVQTEAFRLTHNAIGTQIQLNAALQRERWGTLQYFNNSAIVVDERAEVANLSRPIVIQGANDQLWNNSGFGAHVMAMAGAKMAIEGVAFSRVGQAGKLGRYPIHWHNLSYDEHGKTLPDATGQFVRNSTISNSSNRCITIHGTNGIELRNNICFNIKGHAIFLEDAVERRNQLVNNLVTSVRAPTNANALLKIERPDNRSAASGFWITHPDNLLRGNSVSDSEGHGYWLAFPAQPLGSNKLVPTVPGRAYFGTFENNSTHSNRLFGHFLDQPPSNDLGEIIGSSYVPVSDDGDNLSDWGSRLRPFEIKGLTSWKHRANSFGTTGAVWNRAIGLQVVSGTVSSFQGAGLAGAAAQCKLHSNKIIGKTTNTQGISSIDLPSVGAASYHGGCQIFDNFFVNLPLAPGKQSGAFATEDYYTEPVEKTFSNNFSNALINADPGFRAPSPNFSGLSHAFAGAIWDPEGLFGTKGNYWVYNTPFFTAGSTCTTLIADNGSSCRGPYYGIRSFVINNGADPLNGTDLYNPRMSIKCSRAEPFAAGANFEVPAARLDQAFGGFRHCAALRGSEIKLEFPGQANPVTSLGFQVTNLLTDQDSALLSVPFESMNNVRITANGILLTSAPNIVALRSSSAAAFWQDRATGTVWIKLMRVAGQSSDPLLNRIGFHVSAQ